jgi:glycosyltransferase involved in cell wall biosynthesis
VPKISALIHTQNDARTLARVLETLRPCDEIVVVDHNSTDETIKVAREYGARVVSGVQGIAYGAYAIECAHDWVLCLRPNEGISEGLEAALLEWKQKDEEASDSFAIFLREQVNGEWQNRGHQPRLINRKKVNWTEELPANHSNAATLSGDLLRYAADGE